MRANRRMELAARFSAARPPDIFHLRGMRPRRTGPQLMRSIDRRRGLQAYLDDGSI